jgi:branched-chain amino acid transport system substrate-binding protein
MRISSVKFAAGAAAVIVTLSAAGCAARDSGGANGSGDPSTASPAPTVSNDWALQYTGGTAGQADPAKSPLVIGYINQEGGVPSFPEATAGLDAAVAYVNKELGGAGGHPVKVSKCIVQTEEDGQRCAVQMANDPAVKFVLIGQQSVGNKGVYAVLSGKKPTIQASPGTVDDLGARDSYAYTPGGPGLIAGMALFIAKQLPNVHRVAVVHAANPAGKASAEQFFKPLLAKLGIGDVTLVAAADNATGPDLANAVQAAGVKKADVLVSFLTAPGCIAIYDALRTLGLKPVVVATGLCFGTPVQQHLRDIGVSGQVPEWYYGAFGDSYFQPDEPSGATTYLAKIKQYGPKNVEYTGFAGYVFADVLTSTKFVNQIGYDRLTPATFRAAAKAFTGPAMLTPGPMKCGYSTMFPSLCGGRVGVEQYKDGHWLPTALGDKAIDIMPILGPGK